MNEEAPDARLVEAERTADRLARLQSIGEQISRAVTPPDIARVVTEQTALVFGARAAAVYARDDTFLRVIDAYGFPDDARIRNVPLNAGSPIADAVLRATPVFVESFDEYLARYPTSAERVRNIPGASRAFACFPLMRPDGAVFAAFTIAFDDARHFAPEERAFLGILARQTAQGLERARLYEQERDARGRLAMLQEAGDLLASSLEYETTLQNVVRAAMPTLGDFGFFDVVEGDEVRRIVHAHQDDELAAVLRPTRWVRSTREDLNLCALSSGRTGYHPEIDDAWMQRIAGGPEHLALLRKLAFRSMITVPLASSGRTLGALTLFFGRSGRHHTKEDVSLAEELARRAAVALENARLLRQREQAIRVRDDFLSIASHELNTPLTSLHLHLHALRKRDLGADVAERVVVAERQVLRLSRLIGELLDVSRISAGRLSLELDSVDLADVTAEVIDRLGAEIARSGSAVTAQLPTAIGMWDRLRLEQVVTNLIVNALKYGRGAPIEVTIEARDGHAVLSVRDRGIGIDPEHQARIFQRFERAVSSREYGGLGLGLWISKQIVSAHGGSLEVESAPGEGSTFRVALPLPP